MGFPPSPLRVLANFFFVVFGPCGIETIPPYLLINIIFLEVERKRSHRLKWAKQRSHFVEKQSQSQTHVFQISEETFGALAHREAAAQKRQPWTETVEEFGARLRDICDHINTHFDAEGLCKGLPSRVQNLGSNPEGSALFLLGMQNSIAHALPRHAPEGCCGDMWGVKLKAGPEPA